MADFRLDQSERRQMIASAKALWDTQTLLYSFTDLIALLYITVTNSYLWALYFHKWTGLKF